MAYPLITRLYYTIKANQDASDFTRAKEGLSQEEINERIALAYNDGLTNNLSDDPYDKEKIDKGRREYARMLELNEKIGVVDIPKIDTKLPIYDGTSEEVLQRAAGHIEGTSLPIGGNTTHAVITAHRDLPRARLFSQLDQMKVGDKFYVENVKEIMAYQVDEIVVIEPRDFQKLMVKPGHNYVTLLTCTPYMINSQRLLVRGPRVPYVPAVDEPLMRENKAAFRCMYPFYASLVVILVLLLIFILGLGIFVYPAISNFYYRQASKG